MTQRILIIGSGFAGLWSALSSSRLLDIHNRNDVEVVVLAPEAVLGVRPRYYESNVHEKQTSLGPLYEAVGVRFIKGRANRIDVEAKTVGYTTTDAAGDDGEETTIQYDKLVLAAGSRVVRPKAVSGLEHAFDVDLMEEAIRLENHIKGLKNLPNSIARNTVVIAGGGFTGIETATEMPARLRAALRHSDGDGDDNDNDTEAEAPIRVIIVDRGRKVGSALGENISQYIEEATNALGVQWKLNSAVSSVDSEGVTLSNGERIEANTVVWTVGVRASSLTEQIARNTNTDGTSAFVAVKLDPFGRLHVDRNLKVNGQDHVFATGDTAYAATDNSGINFALMTCQHAINMGRYAGHNVAASLLDQSELAIPYNQEQYVTCLDLGGWGAVYTEGWEREVKMIKEDAKKLKRTINGVWIYPPAADRDEALKAADPMISVVAA